MMKRSGNDTHWSSESCKNTGISIFSGATKVGIYKPNDEQSNSSESSCGEGVHIRKRHKGNSKLECSLLDARNCAETSCCMNVALKEAEIRHNCGHKSIDTCSAKSMHALNQGITFGINGGNGDHQCSLKQQSCEHCLLHLSGYVCAICFPSDHCKGFWSRMSDHEKMQFTKSTYCEQTKSSFGCRHRTDQLYRHCPGCDCEGSLCQQHTIPAGKACRIGCCNKLLTTCACMKASGEKNLASVGIHCSGKYWHNNTTNHTASFVENSKNYNERLLTSDVSRPTNPVTSGFMVDKIHLGRSGDASSGNPHCRKDFDPNDTADDDPKSSIDTCAPGTPFAHNCEQKFHESPQSNSSYKGVTNTARSHHIQGNTVILDDSDDDCQENIIQHDGGGIEMESLEQKKIKSLSLEERVNDDVDLCCTDGMLGTRQSSGCDHSCTQSEKSERVVATQKSRFELDKGVDVPTQIFEATESSPTLAFDTPIAAVHPDLTASLPRGFGPRKKFMIDKKYLPLFDLTPINTKTDVIFSKNGPLNFSENVIHEEAYPSNISVESKALVQKPALSTIGEVSSHMWERSTICDLCRKGVSLSLGEWYAWCCGLPLKWCSCPLNVKMKITLASTSKRHNKPRKMDGIIWSGKVHKMCALWSSEVYEDGDKLAGLSNAVRRGRSLICASCKEYGATLGCRVKTCRRSFHYPCADQLATKLCCRMWDGVHYPVACRGHQHVPKSCQNAKEKPPNLKKWLFKGFVSKSCQANTDKSSSLPNPILKKSLTSSDPSLQRKLGEAVAKDQHGEVLETFIEISTDSEAEDRIRLQSSDIHCSGLLPRSLGGEKFDPSNDSLQGHRLIKQESGQSWIKDGSVPLYHMGVNLLSEDISGGFEAVLIPCTNDVDSDPAPAVNYIIENRYLGRAKSILDSLLQDNKFLRAAPSCNGCSINDMDDPNVKPSVHACLGNCQRENDTRYDWQGQSMLGRTPYDRFGRLQLGPQTKDVVECNSRCPCGVDCLNKELQKGICIPLEVFKTRDRGWGVRTMEQICRGKFVVEYIGEVLTHNEAYVRGVQYDLSNSSCLFSADHPNVPTEELLVIDGYQMSNVARFINHSCDGNLRVYRVYSETTDLRFCRIGLYALRDIEIGEELCYDYGYVTCKDSEQKDFSVDPTAIKCMCGSSNCRQWLWTGTSR